MASVWNLSKFIFVGLSSLFIGYVTNWVIQQFQYPHFFLLPKRLPLLHSPYRFQIPPSGFVTIFQVEIKLVGGKRDFK